MDAHRKKSKCCKRNLYRNKTKKDIGQSSLQVAIKCGEFEIIDLLLDNGADPNKESFPHPKTNKTTLPLQMLITQTNAVLYQFKNRESEWDIKKYDAAQTHLFEILDLMKKYSVDFNLWLNRESCDGNTNRWAYLDDFIPTEDKPYEIEVHGKIIKGITKGNQDFHKEIRFAL